MGMVEAMCRRAGMDLPLREQLTQAVTTQQHPRGATLFHAGRPCGDVFFVVQGIVKLVYLSEDGNARVRDFVAENGLFAALECLEHPDSPAWYSASACEAVIVQTLSYAKLRELAKLHPAWGLCLAQLFYDTALNRGRREHQFLMLPPLQRMQMALDARPWLARVQQQDIGVTPVSLSRLRSRAARGNQPLKNRV